jgi:hypothetical protein
MDRSIDRSISLDILSHNDDDVNVKTMIIYSNATTDEKRINKRNKRNFSLCQSDRPKQHTHTHTKKTKYNNRIIE